MFHELFCVTDFVVVSDYVIRVSFDDGTSQNIDFEPVLYGEMWGPLRDVSMFNAVKLDSVAHTLTWPNGADFDPSTLHGWPDYKDELAERAQRWEAIAA